MSRYGVLALLVLLASLLVKCGVYEGITGGPTSPRTTITSAPKETRWVLIKNPMFEATTHEPEYVWVEEDKIPWSPNSLIFGKKSVLAPPEVVAKYGPPPGGGKISALQKGSPRVLREAATPKPEPFRRSPESEGPPTQEASPRGYVVYIDQRLIVVDLTLVDGLKQGSILSLRRGRIPLTHPVTGRSLGELDEEIGTAQVIEVREQFSLAVIQGIRPGFQLRVKDRVVVKRQ